MLKKILATTAVALLALTSTGLAASAAGPNTPGSAANAAVVATAPITAEEAGSLQYMREEEKLAHDVYVTLYDLWGLPVFNNISASEQQHTDAVAVLLERYDVADPTVGNDFGEFADDELQGLYNQLVEQGSESLVEALKVGVAIEEIDILDLQESLAQTTKWDLERVYGNLLAGSENHLRAFVGNLEAQTGETYVPQYMEQADYDKVLEGSQGRSGGDGRRGSQGGQARGGRW